MNTLPIGHSLAHRLGLAGAMLMLASSAQAGPSQSTVPPPGGFASACASQISSGVTYTPGQDLTASFSFWPGKYTCQSQTFSGAGGLAAADAQWSSTGVNNSTETRAEMGLIRLAAESTARNDIQFPVAVSGGGWSDRMVVNLVGHAGEAAVWTFQMAVDGHLLSDRGGASVLMSAYRNNTELSRYVTGFDKGASDSFTTDRQRVGWAASGTSERTISDLVTFAVPITIGESFSWGVYATVKADTGSLVPPINGPLTSGSADFLHTLRYAGSAGVLLGGQLYDNATLVADSGIDWTQAMPVPEPGTWALMLAGLATVGGLARRRLT
jgi:hypothetical protein